MHTFDINITAAQKARSNAWNTVLDVSQNAANLEVLGHHKAAMATRFLALHLTEQAVQYEAQARADRIYSEADEWAALIG